MIRSTLEKKEFIRVQDDGAAKSSNGFRKRHFPSWRDTSPGLPEVEDAWKRREGLKGQQYSRGLVDY
jgi:hypothetical protein